MTMDRATTWRHFAGHATPASRAACAALLGGDR